MSDFEKQMNRAVSGAFIVSGVVGVLLVLGAIVWIVFVLIA